MSSARTLIFLVLLEYCLFPKVVLQYQYQGFSIVLQYKTARLVHPCTIYGLLFYSTRLTEWQTDKQKLINVFLTYNIQIVNILSKVLCQQCCSNILVYNKHFVIMPIKWICILHQLMKPFLFVTVPRYMNILKTGVTQNTNSTVPELIGIYENTAC